MSVITVPVINDSPNTLNVSFQTEFAISPEATNPYMLGGFPTGVTGLTGTFGITGVQAGGPGFIGGPEYINLLQRTPPTTVQYSGYGSEEFELAAYPGYKFFSFDNFQTGKKTVVAFKTTFSGKAQIPCGQITGSTGATAGYTAAVATFYPTPAGASGVTGLPSGSSLLWTGSAIGSVISGQGTTGLTFKATGSTGSFLLETILTTSDGLTVQSSAPFVTH